MLATMLSFVESSVLIGGPQASKFEMMDVLAFRSVSDNSQRILGSYDIMPSIESASFLD